MEKTYKILKVVLLVLVFAALLLGATRLYDGLSGKVQMDTLGAQEETAKQAAPEFTVYDQEGNAYTLADFRGKPVILNFWATWCGPCRMANKEMVPMKESLKDKDIVYIYLTGETSPKATWENMIPDIHGEHFYLTAEQWEYLGNEFGIDGVPTYLVVDPAGEIKYKSVGFPGVAKMKEELLKVAK